MSSTTAISNPASEVLVAATLHILNHGSDYVASGPVQIWDLRDGEDRVVRIEVEIPAINRRDGKQILQMSIDLLQARPYELEVDSVNIDGFEIPKDLIASNPDFTVAVEKIEALSNQFFRQDLEQLRDQAIQEEWAEVDLAIGAADSESKEFDLEHAEREGLLNRNYTRRGVAKSMLDYIKMKHKDL